eukprot:TRINITY_DN33183_c0_g1_i1.p1 TRINITY_DN33183_c0_g1~~TRINITY_DN33183_c0_g1_i1.p1  ORF type:complete len:304 (-),score=46.58 TRINITY_DN33183_c0_g1_i1:515-1426(-)
MAFIHKVYLLWGNWKSQSITSSFFGGDVANDVEILSHDSESPNNIFLPIPSLETQLVLVCNHDVELKEDSLRLAVDKWHESPDRLVGFYPRAHRIDSNNHSQFEYIIDDSNRFSMVLARAFFLHADYFRMYSCAMAPAVREYVEERKQCEDIAMNFLVAAVTGQPPVLVLDQTKVSYEGRLEMDLRFEDKSNRSDCLNAIAARTGSMPLRYSAKMAQVFDGDSARQVQQKTYERPKETEVEREKERAKLRERGQEKGNKEERKEEEARSGERENGDEIVDDEPNSSWIAANSRRRREEGTASK